MITSSLLTSVLEGGVRDVRQEGLPWCSFMDAWPIDLWGEGAGATTPTTDKMMSDECCMMGDC